jgi:hypothetical protein
MDSSALWVGMLFGAIGGGYFLYGKKQADAPAMLVGFLLCFVPYFIPNLIVLSILSLALMAVPILMHKYL